MIITTPIWIKRSLLCGICTLLLSASNVWAQRINKRKISKIFKSTGISSEHFSGFILYDQNKKKTVFEHNGRKYFIPASNTKLFTLYTSLQMLPDSIPGLRYITKGDSLIFWGTGDPSLLHSSLRSVKAYQLLKGSSKKLFYSDQNYKGNFYGYGWSYSNYNDYYQADITALPVFDNVAVASADSKGNIRISPAFLQGYLTSDSTFKPGSFFIKRDISENKFVYPTSPAPAGYKQEIPWKTSASLSLALLQDTLKKPIGLVNYPMPDSAKTLYSTLADSVYKRMMLPSDNFIAEQLLLVCSSTRSSELSTASTINYSIKNFLGDLPEPPQWVDGSGLSRQNLFTPNSIVFLLQKIADKIGNEERLQDLFPAGGKTGTLRNAYKTDQGEAFVWAKTGSLSNNHNQSGYLITRKGKRLIFSFMNNNFTRPTAEIRAEMVRVITEIHNRF